MPPRRKYPAIFGLDRAKRLQRLWGHNPGRNRSREVFGQKRAQRLVFPGLDIACGPVVKKAIAADALTGLADRNGLAHRVSRPDPHPKLEFIVEPFGWSERRCIGLSGSPLPIRPTYGSTGGTDGRSTPVIADRDIFVVR